MNSISKLQGQYMFAGGEGDIGAGLGLSEMQVMLVLWHYYA